MYYDALVVEVKSFFYFYSDWLWSYCELMHFTSLPLSFSIRICTNFWQKYHMFLRLRFGKTAYKLICQNMYSIRNFSKMCLKAFQCTNFWQLSAKLGTYTRAQNAQGGLFIKQNAYVPEGRNEEGRVATPTRFSKFLSHRACNLNLLMISSLASK